MKHVAALVAFFMRAPRPAADAERGATATEYALVVAFIALVVAVSIGFFGDSLAAYIQQIASAVSAAL